MRTRAWASCMTPQLFGIAWACSKDMLPALKRNVCSACGASLLAPAIDCIVSYQAEKSGIPWLQLKKENCGDSSAVFVLLCIELADDTSARLACSTKKCDGGPSGSASKISAAVCTRGRPYSVPACHVLQVIYNLWSRVSPFAVPCATACMPGRNKVL